MSFLKVFGPVDGHQLFRVTDNTWPIEDYVNREGYVPGFVDETQPLPLPGVGRWEADLIELKQEAQLGGADKYELKYTHFSVKMSKSRGLPLFSACNIDGAKSDRDIDRTDVWRRDPRIELQYQDLRKAYGKENEGFFSRGHMTRREDPNWGDKAIAKQADADTFHITNVAPQRQGFNAGIWLDLENYVLNNTDTENLKISVITGPVLNEDDPDYYGVNIPIAFWKIIVFKHFRTKELTTIAYRRSQSEFLPKHQRRTMKFVFGDFDDTQVSVASIEEETGLDLTVYRELDVMHSGENLSIRLKSVSDLYLAR